MVTDLGALLGGAFNFASGVNDNGQIVGGANLLGEAVQHAFVWQDGVTQDLGALPNNQGSFAISINNKGQAVGMSAQGFDGGGSAAFSCPCRAVLWQDGAVIDLNSFVPAGSGWELFTGEAINEKGQIAGQAIRNGNLSAYLLTLPDDPVSQARTIIPALHNADARVGAVSSIRRLTRPLQNGGRLQVNKKSHR